MIHLSQLAKIGEVGRTHGLNGEMNISFDIDIDLEEVPFFVFDIDGIYVPFYIETYRFKNDMLALASFDGISDESAARELYGKRVYITKEILKQASIENEESVSGFLGYKMILNDGTMVGEISHINDMTDNIMLEVGDFLIPIGAVEVTKIDDDKKEMYVNLPDGLLDLL